MNNQPRCVGLARATSLLTALLLLAFVPSAAAFPPAIEDSHGTLPTKIYVRPRNCFAPEMGVVLFSPGGEAFPGWLSCNAFVHLGTTMHPAEGTWYVYTTECYTYFVATATGTPGKPLLDLEAEGTGTFETVTIGCWNLQGQAFDWVPGVSATRQANFLPPDGPQTYLTGDKYVDCQGLDCTP